MIEGRILVTLNHPIDAGFKSPQFFLLVKDAWKIHLKLLFQINEKSEWPLCHNSLNTTKTSQNSPLFGKYNTKMDLIPFCCLCNKFFNCIIKTRIVGPSISDHIRKRIICQPKTLESERPVKSEIKIRLNFHQDKTMIRRASRQVGYLSFWIKKAPLRISKVPIQPFLDEGTNIMLICLSESRTAKAKVCHIARIKAFFEEVGPV